MEEKEMEGKEMAGEMMAEVVESHRECDDE
jgi:hypothetical protein